MQPHPLATRRLVRSGERESHKCIVCEVGASSSAFTGRVRRTLVLSSEGLQSVDYTFAQVEFCKTIFLGRKVRLSMIDVRRKMSALLPNLRRAAKELRTQKRKKRAALICLTIFILMCVLLEVAFLAELENWRKTKFIVILSCNYGQWYLKSHDRLPTTLVDLETVLNDKSVYDSKSPSQDLVLETYRLYKPTWTNVKVSADGKRVEGMVHFEGFWVRERYLVLSSKE